ncbi:MAG: hypothetical protein Q9162_006356 [Coniocarpon cinnabarinum]
MSTTTTLSEMSFIVSNEGGQHELSPHSKQSLVMNGSPRTSTQQPRLASIDTSHAFSGSILQGSPVYQSPTSAQSESPTSNGRVSSDVTAHTYPPATHAPSRQSIDQTLRIPVTNSNTNRRSSPARIPSNEDTADNIQGRSDSSSLDSPLRSAPLPRLQHRHTLEVPQISPKKQSKDGVPRDSDDLPNGRSSGSLPSRRRRHSLTLGRRHTRSYHSDIGLDGHLPEEGTSRIGDAIIRAQRPSHKRRKRDDDDDDQVLVGTKVDQHHANWVTAYNMLTGIRFTVSRINAKIDRELNDDDFEAQQKFSFDITGNALTPGVKYDFKFKDYAPWVFRHLRSIFNIDPADYLVSLTGKYILSELGSPGKSGSFFYFSRDYKYIIKTIHHAEHVLLRKVLKQYYNHVSQHRNTLLSQFYGLHRVKTPWSGKKIHFVVMNNLFPPHLDIHRMFDLKGSLLGRDFNEEDIEKRPRATLKDMNWIRRNMHLELGPQKKQAFVEQMQRDVLLLKELKIMDYSLLVGIHDLQKGNEERLRDKTLKVFQPAGDEANDENQMSESIDRTPSFLESARKAQELRQAVHSQRPVPLVSSTVKMSDEMPLDLISKGGNRYFYQDDGGFRATHEDETPGEAVYYLGIIDCLTKYNGVKKTEHFLKGLAARSRKNELSAVPPDRYGDRFVKFINGVTMSKEAALQADREKLAKPLPNPPLNEKELPEPPAAEQEERHVRGSADTAGHLPVVEEDGEASSTGGRSTQSSTNRDKGKGKVAEAGASSISAERKGEEELFGPPTLSPGSGISPGLRSALREDETVRARELDRSPGGTSPEMVQV